MSIVSRTPQLLAPQTAMEGAVAAQAWPQAPQFPGSELVSTQNAPHAVCPVGQAQVPAAQPAPSGHDCPQPPQLEGSFIESTQTLVPASPEQVRPSQTQVPVWQVKFGPLRRTQSAFALPSSAMPSQSSSFPSHVSASLLHWQTSPVCPASAVHDHPATQLASDAQAVVQTFGGTSVPPSGDEIPPTGKQIPLLQSALREQASPVPLLGRCDPASSAAPSRPSNPDATPPSVASVPAQAPPEQADTSGPLVALPLLQPAPIAIAIAAIATIVAAASPPAPSTRYILKRYRRRHRRTIREIT